MKKLTRTERKIIELVMQGKSNKVIADELSLAESTVKNHMTNIMAKLGVRTRTEAAIVYAKIGNDKPLLSKLAMKIYLRLVRILGLLIGE